MRLIEKNSDYIILEYTGENYWIWLEHVKHYIKTGELIDEYKGYGIDFYYIIKAV